jgi:hypothetical protein
MGIFLENTVEIRSDSKPNGIGFFLFPVTETIQDDQNEWIHFSWNLIRGASPQSFSMA